MYFASNRANLFPRGGLALGIGFYLVTLCAALAIGFYSGNHTQQALDAHAGKAFEACLIDGGIQVEGFIISCTFSATTEL